MRLADTPLQTLGAAIVAAILGVGIAATSRTVEGGSLRYITTLCIGLTGAMGFLGVVRLARRDWFHPAALPLVYVIFALMAPIAYLGILGQPLGSLEPAILSPTLLAAFTGTVVGFAAGIALGLHATPAHAKRPDDVDPFRLRLVGRVVLLVAIPIRLSITLNETGMRYGQGHFDRLFTLRGTLENVAVFGFFAGVLMIVFANSRIGRRPLRGFDVALVLLFSVSTLISGGRGELIAPALAIGWTYQTHLRRIGAFAALVIALVVIVIFQGVQGARLGEDFYGGRQLAIERTLTALATPVFTTGEIIERVPEMHPFAKGSTYLAALKRQLPGPAAVKLFGRPDDTGDFVFRDVIGFNDPNQGFGFSLTAEAYLNFGLGGPLGVGFLVGLLFGWSYRHAPPHPSRTVEFLYPILVCTLPYNLRADALAEVKSVLYPLLFVAMACHLARPQRGWGIRPSWTSTASGRSI